MPVSADTERIHQMLSRLDQARPFPAVAQRVMKACNDAETGARDIAALIQCDPTLTANVLRTANSPLYGFSGAVVSVDHAAVVLGIRALRDLCLSAAAAGLFEEGSEESRSARRQLWEHSMMTGAVAAALAAESNGLDGNAAYLGGITHDIGKLILFDCVPDSYSGMVRTARGGELVVEEETAYGIHHPHIGFECAETWELPEEIGDCIAWHHSAEKSEISEHLTTVVSISDMLAHLWAEADAEGEQSDSASPAEKLLFNQAGLTPDDDLIRAVCTRARENVTAVRNACGAQ